MIFSFNTVSNAASITNINHQYVSQEEILIRLKSLYDKYGVGFEYISSEENINYTEADVQRELKKLEESLKNIEIKTYIEDEQIANSDITLENVISPRFLYTKTYTSYENLSNGISGNATIELSCKATIYDGTITFTDISNISTRQYGTATGFVSWSQNSSDFSYLEGRTIADISAIGTLTTQVTILGQIHRATYDHTIGMYIRA